MLVTLYQLDWNVWSCKQLNYCLLKNEDWKIVSERWDECQLKMTFQSNSLSIKFHLVCTKI